MIPGRALRSQHSMKKLIVNADDFGYTRGVNLGITHACVRGIVTSATIMANGSAFEDAVASAKANPQLGVGVHLVLVGGASVAPAQEIPSLTDSQGNLPASWPALLRKFSTRSIRDADIACELRAQIRRVLEAGIQPTHLDCHKHTHSHPRVMEQLAIVAAEFGIRRVRQPFEAFFALTASAAANGLGSWPQVARAMLARTAAPSFRRIASNYRLISPNYFLGVAATGTLNRATLLSMISSLREGITELMCHPGQYDAGLEHAPTRLKRQREVEMQALTDPAIRAALDEHRVELIDYRGLN